MKVVVRYITRKTSGGVAVRDELFDSESITFGRATACDVELPDPRILLQHAQIVRRSGNLYVEVTAGETISVNGHLIQTRRLNEGDKLQIGPYVVVVEAPEAESDVTLSVELTAPQDDELVSLSARSNLRADSLGVSKRQLSWFLFIVVLAVVLIYPMSATWVSGGSHINVSAITRIGLLDAPTMLWNTGELSASHRFFGNSCEVCHVQPFVPVQDEACASCHPKISHHANPHTYSFASFGDVSCQSCHKEHQGELSIVRNDQEFCADCHRDLSDHTARTTLLNASDFADDHPEFRPSVVINAALRVMDRERSMTDFPPPEERSGINFNHEDHLRIQGVESPVRGNVRLECQNCHVGDDGDISMLSISFETHCQECHALKFDTQFPGRELVHAESPLVFDQINDVYQAVAMRGGYQEPDAPPVLRRRPGTPLSEPQKKEAQDWAAAKALDVMNGRFGRGRCEECHQLYSDSSSSIWYIAPVYVNTQWFPKATFTHKRHTAVACGTCHAVNASVTANDVLMPAIETCRSCHGGENAANRVPSTCVDCHRFHQDDLGVMHPITQPASSAAEGGP